MYEYQCRILRVIDGDTVDIDIDLGFGVWMHRERVRLYGIDTPESRTRDLEEKKFGLLAKAYVRDHLPVGSIQTLVTIKDGKGKFGRILGKFKVGDDILNEKMIKDYQAVEYNGQSKDDIKKAHLENRKKLIENGKA
jgi:micrococcal nuclease